MDRLRMVSLAGVAVGFVALAVLYAIEWRWVASRGGTFGDFARRLVAPLHVGVSDELAAEAERRGDVS